MVSTTPTWGMEPTTSSLGAMSHYQQAKARGASHIQRFKVFLLFKVKRDDLAVKIKCGAQGGGVQVSWPTPMTSRLALQA
jgi:hypothetical protein